MIIVLFDSEVFESGLLKNIIQTISENKQKANSRRSQEKLKKRLYQKKKYNYIKPKKQLSVLLYCYYVYYTVGWNSKNSEIICWNLL